MEKDNIDNLEIIVIGEGDTGKERLESLAELALRHRVPVWQQAALLRYMGWQDGKMLTDAEYQEALSELGKRRLGGGRK